MSAPLIPLLKELIRTEGPLGIERYMAICLGDPRYGYYMTRDPFGKTGDFITSPEISQIFGELIGLWAGECWLQMGAPSTVNLVELGPGRGTLMADALRVLRVVQGFQRAMRVHLVETSPVLRQMQEQTLAPWIDQIEWHPSIETLPNGPCIILANEFFDALPIRQMQKTEHGWHERLVGLDDDGSLCLGLSMEPDTSITLDAPVDAVLELPRIGTFIMDQLARHLAQNRGVCLAIDYGYASKGSKDHSALFDSWQALKNHQPVDPLDAPGECDLTSHVNFTLLMETARAAGIRPQSLLTQRELLLRLGLEPRVEQLSAGNPDQVTAIREAANRLIDDSSPVAMGRLFKAAAMASADFKLVPGFDRPDPALASS